MVEDVIQFFEPNIEFCASNVFKVPVGGKVAGFNHTLLVTLRGR